MEFSKKREIFLWKEISFSQNFPKGEKRLPPTPKIRRFPRLRTPPNEIRRLEQIIWATYNKMHKDRSISKGPYFDIYKSKKFGEDAKHCFMVLADMLARERIDPSLYMKVLAKYGGFGKYHRMPPFQWLMKDKALKVFDWMIEVERSKFIRNEDWVRHLNDPGRENSRHIGSAIKNSWKQIRQIMDTWNLSIGESAIILADRLSPWFLAMCTSFNRLGGDDVLTPKDKKLVEKCLRHLISHKRSFREALDEYSKFE